VENNEFHVVGLLASGQANCQPYVPSVFVHVEKYMGWIKNQTLSSDIIGISYFCKKIISTFNFPSLKNECGMLIYLSRLHNPVVCQEKWKFGMWNIIKWVISI